MSASALRTLQEVNQNLRRALTRFEPERNLSSHVTAEDFAGLAAELVRAGACLRGLEAEKRQAAVRQQEEFAAFEVEAGEYRGNLERLQRFLPDLYGRLLAEKSRLQQAQSQVAAAAAWACASGKTL